MVFLGLSLTPRVNERSLEREKKVYLNTFGTATSFNCVYTGNPKRQRTFKKLISLAPGSTFLFVTVFVLFFLLFFFFCDGEKFNKSTIRS